jgi:hypothetical protein
MLVASTQTEGRRGMKKLVIALAVVAASHAWAMPPSQWSVLHQASQRPILTATVIIVLAVAAIIWNKVTQYNGR